MSLKNESLEELRDRLHGDVRVLMIAISDAWGGLEQVALSDARLLAEAGFAITMLVKQESPLHEHAQQVPSDIEIETHAGPVRDFFDLSFVRRVRAVMERHRINLVHCHQGSLLGSVVPALWRKRHVSLVLSRHILNDHNKKDLYHALLYRRVDYILVLSKTMKRNLARTFPVPEKKLRIVNLGIDLAAFDPERADGRRMREAWKIPGDRFLVGVVGRLDPMKRQDLLIKAMAQVRDVIPTLHGVVVGAESPGLNGSYLSNLQRAVNELRLNDCISIVGPEQNIPDVMAALNLFVMPSQEEAFGLVALEAMAMGVPSLLSKAGSAVEVADRGRGELFRPGDAFDLSRKIRNLYRNPNYRKRMAEKGAVYVRKQHSREQRLHRTLDVYGRCARRRRVELQ